MNPITFPSKKTPEGRIQDEIIKFLRAREWLVKPTHGNRFQSGFPDLFAAHAQYGPRWIEVKLPEMKGSKFTNAQYIEFPKFLAAGVGIWIITGATNKEYRKLFDPNGCNLHHYMRPKV